MKEKVAYLFFICFFSPVLAKTPEWITNTNDIYPNEKYITAVGEGDSSGDAEANAVSYISLYFHTKTDVHHEAVREYNETSSGIKKTIVGFSKSQSLTEHTVITSDADFFCMHFSDTYFDEKTKKYSVLAYIDRTEASDVYSAKIDGNMKDIHNLISYAERQPEILYAAAAFENAEIIAAVTKEMISNAVIIDTSNRKRYEDDENVLSSISSFLSAKKSEMTFCVRSLSYDDRRLTNSISAIMEEGGFSNSPDKHVYTVLYDLVFREEKHDDMSFVYPSLKISIQNKRKVVIESYSRVYAKCGHLTFEGACNRAVMKISDDLNKNFLSIYRSEK